MKREKPSNLLIHFFFKWQVYHDCWRMEFNLRDVHILPLFGIGFCFLTAGLWRRSGLFQFWCFRSEFALLFVLSHTLTLVAPVLFTRILRGCGNIWTWRVHGDDCQISVILLDYSENLDPESRKGHSWNCQRIAPVFQKEQFERFGGKNELSKPTAIWWQCEGVEISVFSASTSPIWVRKAIKERNSDMAGRGSTRNMNPSKKARKSVPAQYC